MAFEDDKKIDDSEKGFAGLSSMVSDIDIAVAHVPSQTSHKHTVDPQAATQAELRPSPRNYQAPLEPSGSGATGKWLLGIGIVIGLIWLAASSDNKNSPPLTPAYLTTTPPREAIASTPIAQPPAAQIQALTLPVEERPPVGKNNIFIMPQISYCLAESIRMESAKSAIDNSNNVDVDRFNGMVGDYNSRCAEFRYRRGALERARANVEQRRAQLQAEGRSRFAHDPVSMDEVVTPRSPQPAQDRAVQVIHESQRRHTNRVIAVDPFTTSAPSANLPGKGSYYVKEFAEASAGTSSHNAKSGSESIETTDALIERDAR